MAIKKDQSISEKLNKLSNSVIIFYGGVSIIVSSTLYAFIGYTSILNSIENNTEKIEITQMRLLKDVVRKAEHNPCIVSDDEWDNYIENYSTLFTLKKKYKKISAEAEWKPMDRLITETEECKK